MWEVSSLNHTTILNYLRDGTLGALQGAQAPNKFTIQFLENLGFTSSNDRLLINLLKELGFLTDDAQPTQRYYDFLDRSQSGAVLAHAVREAYSDLFQINRDAHEMETDEVLNKLRTLAQGGHSETTLKRMASTFTSLVAQADFDAEPAASLEGSREQDDALADVDVPLERLQERPRNGDLEPAR